MEETAFGDEGSRQASAMPAFDLRGKVIIVTGASRGLGKAMATALAEAGATVVLVARNQSALQQSAKDIEGIVGRRALTGLCDVTDEDQVTALVEQVAAECGTIDVVVNNAGIAWERSVFEMSTREFRDTLEVNVVGSFIMAQKAGRHMMSQRRGKIINIGSVDGLVGAPNLVHYCTSKGGVIQLTRALAAEWAKYNIQVNCLCPGYFLTDINSERMADAKVRDKVLARIPLRRFGRPEELGPSIVYLASSATDYMTGQVVVLDGGESAR